MSTRENLTLLDGYRDKCIELAETNRQFVCGYICQKRVSDDPGMINFSPGIYNITVSSSIVFIIGTASTM